MPELSPTALAIWGAYLEHNEWEVSECELKAVAAVLEAAVNRLSYGHGSWAGASPIIDADELLAIAAELKAHD